MKNLLYYKKQDAPSAAADPNTKLTLNPAGPSSNLVCKFCRYAEKSALFAGEGPWQMPPDVVASAIRQHLALATGEEVEFVWKGGEPLLAGRSFFRRAVALQSEWGGDKRIRNRLMTNATLVDEGWADFLAEEKFEVVVNIDGPPALHDRFRLRADGSGSWEDVRRGLEHLQKAGVAVESTTAVNRANEPYGDAVYSFLREWGIRKMAFVPIVEREANLRARDLGLRFATPPPLRRNLKCQPRVSSSSVTPPGYARFLIEVFDRWIRNDVGVVTIEPFQDTIARWSGETHGMCTFNETCDSCVSVEHDGSVFACDEFVYPSHRRGVVTKAGLAEITESDEQTRFRHSKRKDLPAQCRRCAFRFACNGGCPRYRFARTSEGDPGLNYLCNGYQQLFRHMDPYLRAMAQLVEKGRPPADVMKLFQQYQRVGS